MSIKSQIWDRTSNLLAQVFKRGKWAGLVVFTDPLIKKKFFIRPFLNESFGEQMAQEVIFAGKAQGVHDGGDASSAISGTATTDTANKLVDTGGGFTAAVGVGMIVHNVTDDTWGNVTAVDSNTALSLDSDLFPDGNEDYTVGTFFTGAAGAGTWDFADTTAPQAGSNHVSITQAVNLDHANFTIGGSFDFDNYMAVSGQIRLVTYNANNNNIKIQFSNNGSPVGDELNLEDFIDTGVLGSYQAFIIPKAQFNFSSTVVDQMTITMERTSGARPTVYFDVLQIENTGTPIVYTLEAPIGTKLHLEKTVLAFVDNIPLTLADATVVGLSYDKIMNVSKLTNGIGVLTTIGGETFFSATTRSIGDMLKGGGSLDLPIADATNACVVVTIGFPEPIVLDSRDGDSVTFTINDDLSSLISFTVLAIGRTEDIT